MIINNRAWRFVAFFITALAAGSGATKEGVMRSPSATTQQEERPLDSREVSELSCTDEIRRNVANTPGIIMESERVTHSNKLGYIYRYDVSQILSDPKYGSYAYKSIFIVWTADCKTWEIATHPLYQPPQYRS